MYTLLATFRRNRKINSSYFPLLLFVNRITTRLCQVLSTYFVYKYLFGESVSERFVSLTQNNNYLVFSFTGIFIFGYTIIILLNIGRTLVTELRQGTLYSLFMSSYSRIGYFLGVFLEQFSRSVLEMLLLIVVCICLEPQILEIELHKLLVGFVFVTISSVAVALFATDIMLFTRDTYIIQNTMVFIFSVLCGVAVPISYFPKCIQFIAHLIPITDALIAFRELVFGNEVSLNLILKMGYVLALSITYIIISLYKMRSIEYKIVENAYE